MHGGSLKSYEDAAALKITGVRKVVTVPAVGGSTNVHAGVAVIADSTWAAMQGRDALAIEVECRAARQREQRRAFEEDA